MSTRSRTPRKAGARSTTGSRAKSSSRANTSSRAKTSSRSKSSTPRNTAVRTRTDAPRAPARKWSARVMQRSDAMDLETGVFKKRTGRQIALSLRRSVEASTRRKSPPFRSAMSMLNFEINRAGRNLSSERRRVLNQAKDELRKLYHRPPARQRSSKQHQGS